MWLIGDCFGEGDWYPIWFYDSEDKTDSMSPVTDTWSSFVLLSSG
jgi:hypothetical protein